MDLVLGRVEVGDPVDVAVTKGAIEDENVVAAKAAHLVGTAAAVDDFGAGIALRNTAPQSRATGNRQF
ncbi:MAG: hypothetical protein E5X67_35785 [Mesorhizobium sp.]|nr:MAG: hypothetical protein E5X67_35785 [Mesorhizobium sp.]